MAFQSTRHVTRRSPFEEEADENGFFSEPTAANWGRFREFFLFHIYAVMKMFVTQTHATMVRVLLFVCQFFPSLSALSL